MYDQVNILAVHNQGYLKAKLTMTNNTSFYPESPLGTPLPNTKHAVSVSLPLWQDVINYEEGEPHTVNALQSGYPRFFFHPEIQKLIAYYSTQLKLAEDETCLPLPSTTAAKVYNDFARKHGHSVTVEISNDEHKLHILCYKKNASDIVKKTWQHTGYIFSSRHAEDILQNTVAQNATEEKKLIQSQLSELSEQNSEDILLYPSGMNAIFLIHQTLQKRTPTGKTIQLGFPYVDTLKIQELWGNGTYYISDQDDDYLAQLAELISSNTISGVFLEAPSNPLLKTPDLDKISTLLRAKKIPLIVDDTIATWYNIDPSDYADITVTSLTKAFSGDGDVIAGCTIINKKSPLYSELSHQLKNEYEDILYSADAKQLFENSKNFTQRIKKETETSDLITDFLKNNRNIQQVFYPKLINKREYDLLRKHNGGYGTLFSIILKDVNKTPQFYDALECAKGPSLGNNFTIACLYTLLAHYTELEKVEQLNVSRWLIRFSIGLESPESIISMFNKAFKIIE